MNDRYLYRAKRTNGGEWVEGFYAVIGEKTVIIEKEREEFYDVEGEKKSHGNKIVEVESSTICQCTGLRDKNGKLIWENDILLSFYNPYSKNKKPNSRLIVNWDSDVSGTGWFGRKYYDYHYNSYSKEPINKGLYYTEEMERIGNIFDNLELLEVGE